MRFLASHFRAAFAIFFLLGAGVIVVCSAVANQQQALRSNAQWVMVGLVIGLMLLFAVIVGMRAKTELANEGDAEAFYYLGFIYTLVTLVATFTPLLAADAKPSTQHVLGLFGLGLVTTFVGLAGRVFFLQGSTVQSEDGAAQRLARAYMESARQLEATAGQIGRVGQKLEEVIESSHGGLANSLEKAIERIGRDSATAFEKLNREVAALTTQTSGRLTEMVDLTVTRATSRIDEVGARLAALKLPPVELGEQLRARLDVLMVTTSQAGEAAKAFGENVRALNDQLKMVEPAVSTLTVRVSELATATADVTRQVGQGRMVFQALSETAAEMQQSFDGAADSAGLVSPALEAAAATAETLSATLAGFEGSAAAAAASVGSLAGPLGEFSGATHHGVEKLKELVVVIAAGETLSKQITDAQQAALSELLRNTEIVKSHQERVRELSKHLADDLLASEEAVRKVHGNLIGATQFITSKVQ